MKRILIKAITLLLVLCIGLIALGACDKVTIGKTGTTVKDPEDADDDAVTVIAHIRNSSKPNLTNTISDDLQQELARVMEGNATDEEKAEAAINLFILATLNKSTTNRCVTVRDGIGSSEISMGAMATGRFETGIRAFGAQDNNAHYYQRGAKVIDTNIMSVDTFSVAFDYQERAYCSADHNTCRTAIMHGNKARIGVDVAPDEIFRNELPLIALDVKDKEGNLYEEYEREYTYEQFKRSAFILNDPSEFTNYNLRKEVIQDVEIKTDSVNGQPFYDISFIVNLSDTPTVEVARAYTCALNEVTDLDFMYLKVNMKIWNNGYIRSYSTIERWSANANMGPIAGRLTNESVLETNFYWDYESLVADGILLEDDPDIHKDTYTADIIKKFASEPGWVSAE